MGRFLRRRKSWVLALALAVVAFVIAGAKKIFDYSAAPNKPKESDFVFPEAPDQEKPVELTATASAEGIPFEQRGGFTNDASHLNKTAIFGIVHIKSEDDVRKTLQFARANGLKVTCAGQQHSMGGQTFTHGGIVLDLHDFNRITVDNSNMRVNIQSGARWWQLQELLDKQGLAVKAMQSINIFSVGGTLSVNAHGIDPVPGPVAPTVGSLRVMLSNGDIVTASPTENAELFRHVLGGYGLFGVILDADLDIVPNEMYSRETVYMDYRDYPKYYRADIEGNGAVGLTFGRLSVSPGSFLRETAVHIYRRAPFDRPLPALVPDRHEAFERFVINFSKTGDIGRWFRWELEKNFAPRLEACVTRNQAMDGKSECLISRNEGMYDNMGYLENRLRDTDILQEYFVPYDRMPQFVDGLRDVVERNRANLLNVTIRTVHKDEITALPYARDDMFGFVLYFNVKFNQRDNNILEKTTSDLIDAAEQAGGTYYLPYQLFYSPEQLRKSYPGIDDFFAAKRKFDPLGLFTNKFYEKYGS
ncbi:MAG TPA: FAD-binding oxidoreductase [Candidatus Limnocylindrales bacterium]|nr:FAD-binding oxidoreductase [Candidatus Limnocylindrales bacterium]